MKQLTAKQAQILKLHFPNARPPAYSHHELACLYHEVHKALHDEGLLMNRLDLSFRSLKDAPAAMYADIERWANAHADALDCITPALLNATRPLSKEALNLLILRLRRLQHAAMQV